MAKKYMVAGNVLRIAKKLDDASSDMWNAIELINDMDFEKLEGEDKSLMGINAHIDRLSLVFEDLVGIKNHFETIVEELRDKKEESMQ